MNDKANSETYKVSVIKSIAVKKINLKLHFKEQK